MPMMIDIKGAASWITLGGARLIVAGAASPRPAAKTLFVHCQETLPQAAVPCPREPQTSHAACQESFSPPEITCYTILKYRSDARARRTFFAQRLVT